MNIIYKICLALAIFILSASVVWAGFNFDSANGYFLVDSIMHAKSNNIAVGSVLADIPDSFAISNNLIFWPKDSSFKSNDNSMILDIDNNEVYLQTRGISINNAQQDFAITTIEGSLDITSPKININRNFIINNGLTFTDSIAYLSPNTIEVENVFATALKLMEGGERIIVPGGNTLYIESGGTATAQNIFFDEDKYFCQIIYFENVEDDYTNNGANKNSPGKGASWAALGGAQYNNTVCPEIGGNARPTGAGEWAQKTCCPKNYYVFDINVDYYDSVAEIQRGKMVCCKAIIERD